MGRHHVKVKQSGWCVHKWRSPRDHQQSTRVQGRGWEEALAPRHLQLGHLWEAEPDLSVCAWESLEEARVNSGLPQGQGHWLQQSKEPWHAGRGPFEGGCHSHYYPYCSLALGQTTRREHSPIHQQKIGLKTYWAWPCPPEQDPVFCTASSSHQEACTSFLSSSIRGQTEWKPQSQNTNQTDHRDHNLV